MVIEEGSSKSYKIEGQHPIQGLPKSYSVVIRVNERSEEDAVTFLVRAAFGDRVDVRVSQGGRIGNRIWLEVGSFPREIAEARAERVRRNAVLGGLGVNISIRPAP